MYRVFISYAQQQVASALNLQSRLSIPETSVFVAERDLPAGDSLRAAISSEIKQCDLFIVLWTEAAAASKYVSNEIFVAKTEGKKILPLVLQHGVPLPPILGDVKYLDVTVDPEGNISALRTTIQQQAKSKAKSQAIVFAILGFLAVAAMTGE